MDPESLKNLTESLLARIRSLGYAVSVHQPLGGLSLSGRTLPVPERPYTELHAVSLSNPDEQHIARIDDIGPDAEYLAAVELARMVGVDLAD